MKPIIEITGLGKRYPIVHDKVRYGTLRDTVVNFLSHPFRSNQTRESFWALKDINLTINRGDIVGIIGKNGAGKSTLLKILSGITKPTEGKVKLYGRVSSLLEVGTGFHPELTGRENIFLNGVILGMTRKEVAKKFDEIVAFAGIEKFLDTPVKHYSSGMYVRLAFAVAAHLEPDILIVDEVLAVGDVEFQKKCLGKIGEISKKENRTIIIVSHNMAIITSLTNKVILLDAGRIIDKESAVAEVVRKYIAGPGRSTTFQPSENKYYQLINMSTFNKAHNNETEHFSRNEIVCLIIKIKTLKENPRLVFGFSLFHEGQRLYYSLCTDTIHDFLAAESEREITAEIPTAYLNVGKYDISFISGIHPYEWIEGPDGFRSHISFEIDESYHSDSPYWKTKRPGLLAPIIKWS